MTEYLVKRLPYNTSEGFPQKINMMYKGNVYQVTYRRNSFNDDMIIEILRMRDRKKVFTGKITSESMHPVRDPDNGDYIFILYAMNAAPSNLNIWLIDEDMRQL